MLHLLLNVGCVVGLVLGSYRSFKSLKDDAPVAKSALMLQFWVLFAALQFLSGFVEAYTRELKFVLIVLCFLPKRGRIITPSLYKNTVAPLFRNYGAPTARRLQWLRRRIVTACSRMHRQLSGVAITSTLPWADLAELEATEASLQDALDAVAREARRRRTHQLKRSRQRMRKRARTKQDELRPGDGGNGGDGGSGTQYADGKVVGGQTRRVSGVSDTSSELFDADQLGATTSEDEAGLWDADGAGAGDGSQSGSDYGEGDDTFDDDMGDPYDEWVQVSPRGVGSGSGGTSFTPAPALRRRRTARDRHSTGGIR